MDEIVHQPIRLRIMAALNGLRGSETLDFARLKKLVAATDGNLGAHLATLENAGYVTVLKEFVARKPHTRVNLTRLGRKAFAQHVADLRDIIDGNQTDLP
jgi:DNA-binding MarR family transcriptional regulator